VGKQSSKAAQERLIHTVNNKSHNQRSYARVIFNRSARLIFTDRVYEQNKIRDLSLIGIYLEGRFEAQLGDKCTVEIQETGPTTSLTLTIAATVVRIEPRGVGLKFEDMKQDTYMFLQTMILYATKDPLSVAEEFREDFPPKHLD